MRHCQGAARKTDIILNCHFSPCKDNYMSLIERTAELSFRDKVKLWIRAVTAIVLIILGAFALYLLIFKGINLSGSSFLWVVFISVVWFGIAASVIFYSSWWLRNLAPDLKRNAKKIIIAPLESKKYEPGFKTTRRWINVNGRRIQLYSPNTFEQLKVGDTIEMHTAPASGTLLSLYNLNHNSKSLTLSQKYFGDE